MQAVNFWSKSNYTEIATLLFAATICDELNDHDLDACWALDPDWSGQRQEVEDVTECLLARALSMDGICTGKHGMALVTPAALLRELGKGAGIMGAINHALNPVGTFNPGKIFFSS